MQQGRIQNQQRAIRPSRPASSNDARQAKPQRSSNAPARLKHFAGPLIITTAMVVLLLRTWLQWTDPQVDYGHQLYVAWQLNEGVVLYRDVAYMYGPLTPYFNALVFRILGTHLLSQAYVNLAVFIGLLLMLRWLLSAISSKFAADIACLFMVLVFGFSQLTTTANYNYVTPYAHEMVHGFVLGIGALCCFAGWLRRPAAWKAGGAGLCCGLAFLIKPELFIAAIGATAAGAAMACWLRAVSPTAIPRSICAAIVCLIVPPVLAFFLFRTALESEGALAATLGAWMPMTKPGMTGLAFYRVGMGTDDVLGNLVRMAGWSAVLAAIVGLMIALAASIARMQNRAVVQSCLVVMVVAISFVGGWWAWAPPLSFHNLTRVLPVIALTSAVACIVQSRRSRDDPAALPRSIVAASFSIFATAMLLKMLLNARIHHYGFVLAAPASMLLIICMLSWIPAGLAPRMSRGGGRAAAVFQLVATAALLGVAACVLQVSHRTASARIYPVNNGRDSFIADARGLVINSGLRLLDEQLDPDDTLAVLPEGVMINYLARRVNPTGYTSYLPSDLAVHGEATILAAFQKKPPDYIIVIHRDTSEFEMGAFGIGYAKDLLAWITSNYSLAGQVGEIPVNQRLGLVLLKHIPPNP